MTPKFRPYRVAGTINRDGTVLDFKGARHDCIHAFHLAGLRELLKKETNRANGHLHMIRKLKKEIQHQRKFSILLMFLLCIEKEKNDEVNG